MKNRFRLVRKQRRIVCSKLDSGVETLGDQRLVCCTVFIVFRELTIFSVQLSFRPGFVAVREYRVVRFTIIGIYVPTFSCMNILS